MKEKKGILEYLNFPGIISMLGLAFGWIAVIMLLNNLPFMAITLSIVAFYFDCLDGYIARKIHKESEFGRYLDGYFDFLNYLVFSALLFWLYISPNIIGVIVGFIILSTGAFRLSRFNVEGFIIKNKRLYYSGITVVHVSLAVIILFFTNQFFPQIITLISVPIMIIVCILQVSRIPIKKTGTYTFWLTLAFILLILSIAFHIWR